MSHFIDISGQRFGKLVAIGWMELPEVSHG